tara:strand:- start:827 stop:1084 length:258 start_codon:yes stop_codon:yes gene_type:complete
MNTSKRKQLSGVVSSNKMNSTVVVKVVRKIAHPVYKKYVNRTKKYYAHDPKNSCGVGDLVTIEESKPISKLKRWRIKLIQEKAVN